jgi:hypothetical protein
MDSITINLVLLIGISKMWGAIWLYHGIPPYRTPHSLDDHRRLYVGEKPGMKKLFTYVLPRGFAIASHQTVRPLRRDLDLLYEQLAPGDSSKRKFPF